MPNRTHRRAAWVAAVTLAVAVLVSAGHRHEQHQATDVECAVCTVAHHSPALEAGGSPAIAAPTQSAAPPASAPAIPATQRGRSTQSGRAPPTAFLA